MGGNFHLPREAWGPVTGPVHPGCMCPGYSFYDPKLVAAINDAADEILATYRR